MDRAALVDRCEVRYRDQSGNLIVPTEWHGYLADAEADVYAASPWWPFLEAQATNAVTSTGTVTLPDDVFRVTAVYNDSNGYPLVPLEGRSDYRYFFPSPDQSLGTPTHYRLRANVLEVYPRPASSVSLVVDYFAAPTLMALDTDEPAFPETYHRMLVAGALAYAYEDDGNMEQAAFHKSRFEQMLDRMKDELLQSRTERYHGIVDDFGF